MSNLQPLKWQKGAALDTFETVHELVHYTIRPDIDDHNKYRANLGNGDHKTLNSVEEAKQWIETDYYPHKMQPYVKPMPTWIDINERLPEHKELLTDKDKCLVLTECGKVWTGFYNMHIKPDDWYLHGWAEKQGWHPFKIVAWMLASEFSTMQNNKGE